ncbi:MAG TPA: 3-oxoacyl-ACP reductase [Gammaproteobacteria bacterium]|jgi:3-oxoacyl-[acyl-carrier protein] reductase|nr:3-oxoacyl-ACP reductase [Gammaproteobacteria bacterium]HAF74418.1 3-oxoacyl-ACP reductase [Gammaproteobacteria bacterium]|tara:strand:- start:1160 stop:1897 length:738 start_codon:yes stop_codon:yes gene_type:complete
MSQICLVTGASRGIGKAIALELATQGHTVIGTGTSPASAENVTTDLRAARAQGRGAVLDVNDLQQIESVVNEITDEFGPISVLVNNAGVTEDNLLMRMKPSQWEKTLNTNLAAVFALTKLCLKGMTKARYGRIINLSSVVGATGNAGQTNYAASKAGLIGFTKSLALEIASRGITVNAVAPGFIDTDMTSALAEEQRSKLLEAIPLARLGRAEDISKAVAFLVSDDASYITGQVLHVNGGMHMSS